MWRGCVISAHHESEQNGSTHKPGSFDRLKHLASIQEPGGTGDCPLINFIVIISLFHSLKRILPPPPPPPHSPAAPLPGEKLQKTSKTNRHATHWFVLVDQRFRN